MITMLFALSSIGYVNEITIPDAPALIDSIYNQTNDVYFEYEGVEKGFIPDDSKDLKPGWFTSDTFNGLILFRKDGAVRLESFHLKTHPKFKPTKSDRKLSALNGKRLEYHGQGDSRNANTRNSSSHDTVYPGSIGRIYFVPFLKSIARYDKVRLIHEGDTVIDGHKCEIYSFVMGKDFETISVKNAVISYRFYLDMARGGHAIKAEQRMANELVTQALDIQLGQFKTSSGSEFWLPISGRFEAIMPARVQSESSIKPGTVYGVETFSVKRESVKANQRPDDEQFKIRLDDGTLITDQIKSKPTVYAKSKPFDREEEQKKLDELIREGEEKGTEIIASSPARSGRGSFPKWIPVTFGCIALAGFSLAGLLYKTGIGT